MKIKKKLLCLIPLLAIPFLNGCSAFKYEIVSIEKSTPECFEFDSTDAFPTLIKSEDLSNKIPVYKINDKDIAYLDLATGTDLFANYTYKRYPKYSVEYKHATNGHESTITNSGNNSTCVINYDNQTMKFDDYMAFICSDKNAATPLDTVCSEVDVFQDVTKVSYEAPKNPLVIDLKKYDIPVYTDGKEGYLPLEVYSNLLCDFSRNLLTYANGTLYLMAPDYENIDSKLRINKKINAKFSESYMEYCYNLAALTLDTRFGLRERKSRAVVGPTIKFTIDAYANMNKQGKSKFLSTEPNVANQALINTIFDSYDDGGHTGYFGASLIDNAAPTFKVGDEFKATEIAKTLSAARTKRELSPAQTTGNSKAIGDFTIYNDGQNNDTAFLTMDAFEGADFTSDYYRGTNTLVRYANQQLRTETGKKVKNLVVDLSVNTGGAVWTERFMDSWLTRGNSHAKICSNLTGGFSDITYKADIDGNGIINDNDYLPNTVEKIYFIVTPSSFSCGNALPCQVKDYGQNVHFIGNNSGGGACFVKNYLLTGYGSFYQVSSHYCACRKEATATNLVTNDDGVGVRDEGDYEIKLSEPDEYYNREDIVKFIHK